MIEFNYNPKGPSEWHRLMAEYKNFNIGWATIQ